MAQVKWFQKIQLQRWHASWSTSPGWRFDLHSLLGEHVSGGPKYVKNVHVWKQTHQRKGKMSDTSRWEYCVHVPRRPQSRLVDGVWRSPDWNRIMLHVRDLVRCFHLYDHNIVSLCSLSFLRKRNWNIQVLNISKYSDL